MFLIKKSYSHKAMNRCIIALKIIGLKLTFVLYSPLFINIYVFFEVQVCIIPHK